jgi:hypothetical protein
MGTYRTRARAPLLCAMVLLTVVVPTVADSQANTNGGVPAGVLVRDRWRVRQDAFPDGAEDLHFTVRNKEVGFICVNGWDISISGFANAMSGRQDPCNNIRVNADGGLIAAGGFVDVDISLWLGQKNSKQIFDAIWTKPGQPPRKAAPGQGWDVGPGRPGGGGPGGPASPFLHLVTILNLDDTDPFFLTDVCAVASPTFFADLTTVPCVDLLLPPILLNPGESFSFDVETLGPALGEHIYFGYTMREAMDDGSRAPGGSQVAALVPGEIVAVELGDHPITETVPEPAPLALLGAGGVLLLARSARRRPSPGRR